MTRTVDDVVPEDQEWKLHFLALTPDGWLFWWDSHEDGLTAITKACERTRNPDDSRRPRRMTSWWGSSETASTKKHKRDRSQSLIVDFVEESPVIQAKAWRALAKFAGESKSKEKMNSEAAELIDGSFHVKASEFSYVGVFERFHFFCYSLTSITDTQRNYDEKKYPFVYNSL